MARDPGFSFKPDIGGAKEFLAARRGHAIIESENERIERLAVNEKKKIEAIKESMRNKHYQQYTFRPQISEGAKKRKAHSVEELYSDELRKRRMERDQKNAEREMMRECTFQVGYSFVFHQLTVNALPPCLCLPISTAMSLSSL